MRKFRSIILTIFALITAFALSGCQYAILNPKGVIAAQEKNLMITSIYLMLIVVIPVIFLSFFFAWRYRDNNQHATYAPDWSHSTLLEIIWWSIPLAIIFILGIMTFRSSYQLDPYKPILSSQKKIVIEAVSLEWKWLFIYPEQHIATINYLELPVGVPVEFLVTAEGPMNSFQIPQLAGQIYAMAGMRTKLHLVANEVGDYQGISANFTGDGFSDMKFIAHVATQNEFDQWVKNLKTSKNNLNEVTYEKLIQPSVYKTYAYFASASDHLFDDAIMKNMMPMKNTTKMMTHSGE